MRHFTLKSQATLEFLTTYMWAFLVILIMIAALAYLSILSPSKLLPERCSISPEIECVEYNIGQTDAGTGILRLRLKNKFPEPIVVVSWDTSSESETPFSCAQKPVGGIWSNEETKDFEFTGCNNDDAGLLLGKKSKVDIKMNYYMVKSGASFSKEIEGEVFATVTGVEGLLTQPECNDDTDNDDNGCIDYDGGDTGCYSSLDPTESGGICPGGGPVTALDCFVSVACSDTVVFKMSALSDAHAEIPSQSNYDKKVCCRSSTDAISNSCPGDAIPLRLSANSDAHVEKNTESNFNVNVCLSAVAGTVSCSYKANCDATETCLATISADRDAHVADCVTQPYATKICCSLT